MLGAPPRVVVLGGGFAGLETAYYLRKEVGERADITIVSERDRFLFKPNTIYIPFGLNPEKLMVPIAGAARKKQIDLQIGHADEVDPERRTIRVNGNTINYDYLVVATGATMNPDEIPGLGEHANTIWTPEEMLRLRAAFDALLEDAKAGRHRQVLFLVPPNNKCSGPLYEMVFMLDTWLRKHSARKQVEIAYSTFERGYIQAFGPRLNTVVTDEFERRGIHGHTTFAATAVEAGGVRYANGETLPFDLLVAFPPYRGGTTFASLPVDDRGFIKTDPVTRQVAGIPRVYAAGDAGDFPVKQAFLAFLQGDAVAREIAADVLGTGPAEGFDPVSMCVMEQFDKATFAQVPLRLTGRPELPVEVRPDANGAYRVGAGRTWRLGKKALGLYLPWRFRSGEPFHAGLPWKGMELSLKAMSKVLAK